MRSCMTLYGTGRMIPETDRVFWALSALLCRRLYSPLKLYADPASAKRLIVDWGISFDEVDTTTIPRDTRGAHRMCWSAGKLAAMRSMAENGEPFFHIDGDAFVFQPLADDILNARMFAQCIETKINRRTARYRRNTHYPLNELLPDLQMPKWMQNYHRQSQQEVINMGIFGGTDCNAIYEYADASLKTFVKNRLNVSAQRNFHRSMPHFLGLAVIAEQWCLAAYCYWKKIRPVSIMKRIDSFNLNRAHEVGGYVHIYSALRRRLAYRKWAKNKLKTLLSEELDLQRMAA